MLNCTSIFKCSLLVSLFWSTTTLWPAVADERLRIRSLPPTSVNEALAARSPRRFAGILKCATAAAGNGEPSAVFPIVRWQLRDSRGQTSTTLAVSTLAASINPTEPTVLTLSNDDLFQTAPAPESWDAAMGTQLLSVVLTPGRIQHRDFTRPLTAAFAFSNHSSAKWALAAATVGGNQETFGDGDARESKTIIGTQTLPVDQEADALREWKSVITDRLLEVAQITKGKVIGAANLHEVRDILCDCQDTFGDVVERVRRSLVGGRFRDDGRLMYIQRHHLSCGEG